MSKRALYKKIDDVEYVYVYAHGRYTWCRCSDIAAGSLRYDAAHNRLELRTVVLSKKVRQHHRRVINNVLPIEAGLVYLLYSAVHKYKIGMTINLQSRLVGLVRRWGALEVVHTIPSPDMINLEAVLHHRFSHCNTYAEWFDLTASDVRYLCSLGAGTHTTNLP